MSEPQTLAQALEATWRRWPDRVALADGDRRISYAELETLVGSLAAAYPALGIERGDRVVCSVSNRPELIVALGAAWVAGAIHVGVDYQSTPAELSAVVALTEARALIYEPPAQDDTALALLRALHQAHPDLSIVVVGDAVAPARFHTMSGLLAPGGPRHTPDPPAPDDPAMIFISSGTTGTPKAALNHHGNLCRRWLRLAGWLRFGPEDVHLAHLPLAHGFGLMMAVAGLFGGGRLVMLREFSGEAALAQIGREQVTVLNGAPAHFKLVLGRLDPQRHSIGSLRLSVGTAALFPPPLVQAIWERLGVEFMFMYGSSEGLGVATTEREDILLGSVGRPATGAVRIVGPDRAPLPAGEVGEIAFSRRVFPVQYWRGAGQATPPSAHDDVWYYSGDLGRLDEQGRLYVFGRLKHQIDRGGIKVDPVEVEAALLRCAGVSDAAVIGVHNPILGESVCACVVPATGQQPTLSELRAALGVELAPHKLPEELCLLGQIPRTQIGKVDLARLREEVRAAERQQIGRG
ncbi:MAG TPA: class I adenylate-forming enzyme family protein [Roseiflexaceae bacterium]|nr:class I adenylate-forming enzyme family protein [Roseiflexaceae bacterium]